MPRLLSQHLRCSLLATICVAAAALSCSTACLTSAIVSEASNRAARTRLDREDEQIRERLKAAAASALGIETTPVDPARLRVVGARRNFAIEANGNYSAGNAKTLTAALRSLYGPTLTFDTTVTLEVYNDIASPRVTVARTVIDLAQEVHDALVLRLPSGSRRAPALRVSNTFSRDGKTLYVNATGNFTPAAIEAFKDAVRTVRARLPGGPQLFVRMLQDAGAAQPPKLVSVFPPDSP